MENVGEKQGVVTIALSNGYAKNCTWLVILPLGTTNFSQNINSRAFPIYGSYDVFLMKELLKYNYEIFISFNFCGHLWTLYFLH